MAEPLKVSNGAGIRDTTRVLKISPNTVLQVLRESADHIPEPTLPMHIQNLEIDEQWSFVQRKKQQNWLWYALDRHSGEIVAFVLGRGTDASCKKLVQKLALCQRLVRYKLLHRSLEELPQISGRETSSHLKKGHPEHRA